MGSYANEGGQYHPCGNPSYYCCNASDGVVMEIKIHKVYEGPHEDEDGIFLEVLAEVDGEMEDATIWFVSFDDAYEVVKHMSRATLEPYSIEVGEGPEYD